MLESSRKTDCLSKETFSNKGIEGILLLGKYSRIFQFQLLQPKFSSDNIELTVLDFTQCCDLGTLLAMLCRGCIIVLPVNKLSILMSLSINCSSLPNLNLILLAVEL